MRTIVVSNAFTHTDRDAEQAFAEHIKQVYASDEFKSKSKDAEPFFAGVRDFIFGRPANLQNIVSSHYFYLCVILC